MPNKEFLEEYPLYRKYSIPIPETLDNLQKIRINMPCQFCKSSQTFAMTNDYFAGFPYRNSSSKDASIKLEYICVHCQKFTRYFYIIINNDLKSIMKVGQYPSWDIIGDPIIEKMLGKYSDFYKKGLICESQGYGIGAFGYYRRIVENIIDELLNEISNLLSGIELDKYKIALKKTKETIVTQEKIDIVKDLLPPILRPNGMNPLSVLHSALSEGLHAESDEECLKYSETLRQILIFLANQISSSLSASKSFTDNMRKILDKKSK